MMTTEGAAAQEAMFGITENHEGMDALRDLVWLRKQADAGIAEQIQHLREIDTPWSVIALVLGVSKQAAQQRYGE
jgi:hypothetical protein